MSTDKRTIEVILTAKDTTYSPTMRRAGSTTRKTNEEVKKTSLFSAAASGKLSSLAMGLGVFGAAAAGSLYIANRAGMAFDKTMSAAYAATRGTADANIKMWAEMREAALSVNGAYDPTQAAQAMTELIKSGRTASQVMKGELDESLNLAAADSMDLATATSIMASTMTVFGRQGITARNVSDTLAAGAGLAQGGVTDLGEALKYAGSQASSSNVSLGETTGLLATLANNGMQGSMAGTALAGILRNLKTPTAEGSSAMKDLNLEVYDAQGNFKGITPLLIEMSQRLNGLTDKKRSEILSKIFDVRALNAAIPLLREAGTTAADGGTQLEYMNKQVQQSGYAAGQAATQLDNLAGDTTKFNTQMQVAFIESSSGAAAFGRGAVQAGTNVLKLYNALPAPIKNTGTALTAIAGGAALAGAGLIKTVEYAKKGRDALVSMGIAAGTANKMVKGIGIGAGIAGAALAVGLGVIGYFSQQAQESADRVKDIADSFDVINNRATTTNSTLEKVLEQVNSMGMEVGQANLGDYLKQAGLDAAEATKAITGTDDEFSAFLANAQAKVLAYRQSAAGSSWLDLLPGGNVNAQNTVNLATSNLTKLRDEQLKARASAEELARNNNSLGTTFTSLGQAQTAASRTIDPLKTGTSALAQEVNDANDAIKAEIASLYKLRDAFSSALADESSFEGAIDNATDALDKKTIAQLKGKSIMDLDSAAVRKADDALRNISDTARAYGAELITQGYSQTYATAVSEKSAAAIVKQATAWGFSKKEAIEFAAAATGVPKSVVSTLTLKGATKALEQISSFEEKFKDLPVEKRIEISTAIMGGDIKAIKQAIKDLPVKKQIQILSTLSESGVKGAKGALADVTAQAAKELKIKLNGKDAKKNAEQVKTAIDKVQSKTVTITVNTRTVALKAGGGEVAIGAIRGAGSSTSDSIEARLSNGEHVWPTSDVNAAGGQNAVYRIRAAARAGTLRGFANGGAVERRGFPVYPVAAGIGQSTARSLAQIPIQYNFRIENHYPQAESTSVTTNRALQYAGALGRP